MQLSTEEQARNDALTQLELAGFTTKRKLKDNVFDGIRDSFLERLKTLKKGLDDGTSTPRQILDEIASFDKLLEQAEKQEALFMRLYSTGGEMYSYFIRQIQQSGLSQEQKDQYDGELSTVHDAGEDFRYPDIIERAMEEAKWGTVPPTKRSLKPRKEDWNTKYLEKRGFVSSEDELEDLQEAPRSSWATSSNTSFSEKEISKNEMVHVDDTWATSSNTSFSEKEISKNEMVHVDDTWAADTTSGNESAVEESTSKEIRALWATTSSGTDVTSSGTDDIVWASQSETDDDKLDTMISLLDESSNAAWASEEDD